MSECYDRESQHEAEIITESASPELVPAITVLWPLIHSHIHNIACQLSFTLSAMHTTASFPITAYNMYNACIDHADSAKSSETE